jgi:hypothetical protein
MDYYIFSAKLCLLQKGDKKIKGLKGKGLSSSKEGKVDQITVIC